MVSYRSTRSMTPISAFRIRKNFIVFSMMCILASVPFSQDTHFHDPDRGPFPRTHHSSPHTSLLPPLLNPNHPANPPPSAKKTAQPKPSPTASPQFAPSPWVQTTTTQPPIPLPKPLPPNPKPKLNPNPKPRRKQLPQEANASVRPLLLRIPWEERRVREVISRSMMRG